MTALKTPRKSRWDIVSVSGVPPLTFSPFVRDLKPAASGNACFGAPWYFVKRHNKPDNIAQYSGSQDKNFNSSGLRAEITTMISDEANRPQRVLPPIDIAKFHKDGYLVIHNFLPPETVSLLRERVVNLLDEFTLEGHPMTKFSTGETEAHVGDDVRTLIPSPLAKFAVQYFLTSGDKVRYFLEEEAVDSSGNLIKPKARAVNKIGHGTPDCGMGG